MERSCKNCTHINLNKSQPLTGRLKGRFRYGCSYTKSGYISGTVSDDGALSLLVCPGYMNNRKDSSPKKDLKQEYEDKLQALFDRWVAWNHTGSPESEVTDGVYLNRIRQGILRVRNEIEHSLPEEQYPECYYAQTPPLKTETYMVSPGRIEECARSALFRVQENEDFHWLSEHMETFKKEDREYAANRFLLHKNQLQTAIETGDLLTMKRKSRQENLLRELHLFRKQMETKKEKRRSKKNIRSKSILQGQLTLISEKAS